MTSEPTIRVAFINFFSVEGFGKQKIPSHRGRLRGDGCQKERTVIWLESDFVLVTQEL